MEDNMIYKGKGTEGFHVLYIWIIINTVLIYCNLFIVGLVDKFAGEDDTIFHLLAFFLPVVLLVVNLFIVLIFYKKTDRRIFLSCALLVKYMLVPLYAFGVFVMCVFFLLMFTPVVIMVFVSPVVITFLTIYGWCVVVQISPFSIAYLLKAKKEGKIPSFIFKIGVVTQFCFCADVIAVMILALLRERRWIKLTIILLTILAIAIFIISCIIGYAILKAVL